MESITAMLEAVDFDFPQFIRAALLLAVTSLLLGVIGRFIFGKRSTLNHAVSSAIGILFVYAATVALYSAGADFHAFIAPLPFVDMAGDKMTLFVFQGADYTIVCSQLLSMIILAFLANLMDSWVSRGKNLFTWLFFRCLSVALAMILHLLVSALLTRYLPEGLVIYAPTVLLGMLVVLLLVGALKFIVGALLTTVSPVIAAFYTFFFASFVGKQLTKAILTTLILSLLVFGLNYIGCTAVSIASAALIAYIPFLLLLLAVWYFVNKVL